jgi:hypothetical protein
MNKVRIFYLLFFIFYLLNAQNFRYKSDDWYILKKPGNITGITENRFNIYFATESGVYIYDKALEDFRLDNTLSNFEQFSNVNFFHYDAYHDYFWVVSGMTIQFKSAVSSLWRDMDINSGIITIYNIERIGSSPQYFWIESFGELFPFDPLSGKPANWEDAKSEVEFIGWSAAKNSFNKSPIDISKYSIDGDWTVGLNEIFDNQGRKITATVHLEDDEGNNWYGTDAGYILKGWSYSSRLEIIEIGLPFNNVTVAYYDDENWWFADSKFKRSGRISLNNKYNRLNSTPFLSQWNEKDNSWDYFYPDESITIENTDINSIIRVGNIMYFGTMSGLLYLDIYSRDWNIINTVNGLNDAAIWDMVEYNGSIYLATANGINEISTLNHSVISSEVDLFLDIKNANIYDLASDSTALYIASDLGLLAFRWDEQDIRTISKKIFKKIGIENETIMGTDDTLWLIDRNDNELYIDTNVQSFDMCGSFLWKSNGRSISLLDTITSESWNYGVQDGIPSNKIYEVNCDDDWAWFLTDKGLAFYNWSKYH